VQYKKPKDDDEVRWLCALLNFSRNFISPRR
jgi:hypothetical protein